MTWCSSTDDSSVVCLKAECVVDDLACLLNVTKSVQWQHVALPTVDAVDRPTAIVDIEAAGPPDRPTIADLYPTSFDIVAGNDAQLFDVVGRTVPDDGDASRRPPDTTAGGTRGTAQQMRRRTCYTINPLLPCRVPKWRQWLLAKGIDAPAG